MQQTVVQLKDIQEIYGNKWEGVNYLSERTDSKIKIDATFMEEDIPIRVINEVGPFASVYIDGNSAVKFIIPVNKIYTKELPNLMDRLRPLLDSYYPDRWFFHPSHINRLHIYYPELTITNSMGMQHTIYDLVVFIVLNTSNGSIEHLYGKRYSFTRSELLAGYSHSHLENTNKSSHKYMSFCKGGSSKFGNLMGRLNKRNTVKEIEMFLLQLDQYLAWESLEGKPYISMTKIGSGRQYAGEIESLERNVLKRVSTFAFEKIIANNPSLIIVNGLGGYILDISIDPDWFYTNVEKEIIANFDASEVYPLDWDERSMMYVETTTDSTSVSLPAWDDYDKAVLQKLNLTPRLIEDEKPIEQKITKRLSMFIVQQIIEEINTKIINGFITPRVNE